MGENMSVTAKGDKADQAVNIEKRARRLPYKYLEWKKIILPKLLQQLLLFQWHHNIIACIGCLKVMSVYYNHRF